MLEGGKGLTLKFLEHVVEFLASHEGRPEEGISMIYHLKAICSRRVSDVLSTPGPAEPSNTEGMDNVASPTLDTLFV